MGRIKSSGFFPDDAIEFNVASAALELIRRDIYAIENFSKLMQIIAALMHVRESAGKTEAGDDLFKVIYKLENVKDKILKRRGNEFKQWTSKKYPFKNENQSKEGK